MIFFRKSFIDFLFMFQYSSNKVIGYSDIECTVLLARKNIDKILIHLESLIQLDSCLRRNDRAKLFLETLWERFLNIEQKDVWK